MMTQRDEAEILAGLDVVKFKLEQIERIVKPLEGEALIDAIYRVVAERNMYERRVRQLEKKYE